GLNSPLIISANITTKVGTWTVDFDSEEADMPWGKVSWSSLEPDGTSVTVQVRSSNDQSSWSAWETATNGNSLSSTPNGRYLQIETKLQITAGDVSPVLLDLTVEVGNLPPMADAGTDQTVEQTSWDGAEINLDGSASTDDGFIEPLTYSWNWDGSLADGMNPTVLLPLGDTEITLTVYDGQFSDDDTVVITVEDTTPPEVMCVESVNPHGNTIPGEDRDNNSKDKNNVNPDGFYEIIAEDICDAAPDIYIGTADDPYMFGPFMSG
ncbi:unnamed protein product, partial [marine sediment metagenome]